MKLREIIRYELWYQARRPTTWLFLGVLTVGFVYEWRKGALEWD